MILICYFHKPSFKCKRIECCCFRCCYSWFVSSVFHFEFLCLVILRVAATFNILRSYVCSVFVCVCNLFFLLARSPYTVLLSHWIRTPATMFAFATMSHFITHQFATDVNGNTSNTAEHPGRRVVVFGFLSFLFSFFFIWLSFTLYISLCLSLSTSWMSMLILTNSVVYVNLPHLYRHSFRILLSFFSIWKLVLHFFF